MKKILILSYYYPPANFVGAERIASFARHLHKFGYYPVIITRNWNPHQTNTYEAIQDNHYKHEVFDSHEVHYMPYNRSLRDRLFGMNNFVCMIIRRILTVIELITSNLNIQILPYYNLYTQARTILLSNPDIKALIISGSPFESFHFGYLLKKEFPHIQWIPGYRDEWTAFKRYPTKGILDDWIFNYNSYFEKKFTSNASSFISVSEYWVDKIGTHIEKRGAVVLNGFEPKLQSNATPIDKNPFTLKISYSGSIYPNQDFLPLAKLLARLKEKYNGSLRIHMDFFGAQDETDHTESIHRVLHDFDIEHKFHKRIPQSELHSQLLLSDFLYVSKYGDLNSLIPVKVFDYYNLNAPILHYPSDKGEIEKFIVSTNSGYASSDEDGIFAELIEFIDRKMNGEIDKINERFKKKDASFYTREHQASILAKHLDELIDVKTPTYQICNRCVMDTSDEDITFDELGICNHCRDFEKVLQQPRYRKKDAEEKLTQMISQIKRKNNQYDCLIGISGGVDSCYTAYLCHKWGLRPLLMHMDNGWNSEIAVRNIQNLVEKLNLDYISYVLDWNEFREVQLAFLKSSIVDLEIPTDIAIPASLYEIASKYNISYIMSGGNYSGEGILPLTWGYHVLKDAYLYKNIVSQYAQVRLKKIPIVGLWKEIYYKFFKGIKTLYPLNLIEYDKDEAREFLKREFNWTDYGGKHHESKITAFWQSYVMPTKYNMDYRRATYSSQIVSGQIAREQAIEKLKELPYNPDTIPADKEYIAKKFGITSDELEHYLSEPPKTYKDFPNQKNIILYFYSLYKKIANQ